MAELKNLFQLDPQIHFLNHGSFGACPQAVTEKYFEWVRRLERQPVLFLAREIQAHWREARTALAAYLHTLPDQVVYIPNATHGVNIMTRSIDLQEGDEIVITNHEYGACENAWLYACMRSGATVKKAALTIPYETPAQLIEQIWEKVTPQTKAIFFSHITSPTALTLPAAEICARAKRENIITCVDGAHAPGQLPLDMEAIGADFYTGNCHKWMCAPKGSAFLYAAKDRVQQIQPLVVSWGYPPYTENVIGNPLIDYNQWVGTHDPCPALTVPFAIAFQKEQSWDHVIEFSHLLLRDAIRELNEITNFDSIYPNENEFCQLAVAEIPFQEDPWDLKNFLYDGYQVEVPIIKWENRSFVRISVQGYNNRMDIDALLQGVGAFFAQHG